MLFVLDKYVNNFFPGRSDAGCLPEESGPSGHHLAPAFAITRRLQATGGRLSEHGKRRTETHAVHMGFD